MPFEVGDIIKHHSRPLEGIILEVWPSRNSARVFVLSENAKFGIYQTWYLFMDNEPMFKVVARTTEKRKVG